MKLSIFTGDETKQKTWVLTHRNSPPPLIENVTVWIVIDLFSEGKVCGNKGKRRDGWREFEIMENQTEGKQKRDLSLEIRFKKHFKFFEEKFLEAGIQRSETILNASKYWNFIFKMLEVSIETVNFAQKAETKHQVSAVSAHLKHNKARNPRDVAPWEGMKCGRLLSAMSNSQLADGGMEFCSNFPKSRLDIPISRQGN